eukprot:CAMPEP_0185746656 /NCGR_PEP_ID=MMETSP1174-20130828/5269_1 /TAXON_ID=35687 /ORGANISM="Dictyocha speculum, Strain CCMP1381" /LENGTH=169 /DNA_ID=CAMNT_0028421487 /DNA_START=900 /DNA_END=1406 /DNA_ORIENTATION=-
MEKPRLVYGKSRPGNISFDHNGATVAVDACALGTVAVSDIGTDVYTLLDAEQLVKENRYGALCTDREVLFFNFSMTSMDCLSASAEYFHRWLASCLLDTECNRDMFRQYWSRRVVVRTLKCQMIHLISRQEHMEYRYTRVVEQASRIDSCVRNMPEGYLSGLNRGTRRQ